ncbi:MAG: threonine dehydratase, partial [Actinomycetota bacterium]|nr:threonine dehydratase [Actinomycetota bacterium]
VEQVVLVDDDAVVRAQRRLWDQLRTAVEPAAAVGLAALAERAYRPAVGERVGVLLCGANLDPATLAAIP